MKFKEILGIILCILIIVIVIIYWVLFIGARYQEAFKIRECEKKGLVLVYPPFEKPSMSRPCYCGNITELSKIHKMKENTFDNWWYWEHDDEN